MYKRQKKYLKTGRIPWSEGYFEYKWDLIERNINNDEILNNFKEEKPLFSYGIGIDERIVEYPWIISNLSNRSCKLLDAGSTFNYKVILDNSIVSKKEKTIATYYPEQTNFNEKRISYLYCDLRDIPIRSNYFDEIICQSTLEHLDMDNSIYGYNIEFNSKSFEKSYEYIYAVKELMRILRRGGELLITVPFGLFENHGFFQQFDEEMIQRLKLIVESEGFFHEKYFMYNKNGWMKSNSNECNNLKSYNPHTGQGKGNDNAAHSRAICCLKILKH